MIGVNELLNLGTPIRAKVNPWRGSCRTWSSLDFWLSVLAIANRDILQRRHLPTSTDLNSTLVYLLSRNLQHFTKFVKCPSS